MDLSTVRGRRRKSLFRPWNSYLAKKGAVEAAAIARQLDTNRARAHAGLASHTTPLVRLTVKLIDTYEGINANYYQNRPSTAHAHDSSFTTLQPSTSDPYYTDHFIPQSEITHSSINHTNINTDVPNTTNTTTVTASNTNNTNNNNSNNNIRPVSSPLSIQYCDENFDYIVRTGEMFHNRYMLEKVIGRGSFGQVVRALDTRENTHVAIKIIKNNTLYVEQALSEVRMTAYLNSIDPDDEHSIMRLRDKFIFRGHQCLVLELLSFSLYDLLRSTEFYGVSLNLVRKFCKQILKCLSFLARPDVNIAHCDLKPENVLLRHPQRSAIKVVDFGASCRISDTMFVYVQSRFYRAPEVILGLPYSTQVDVWSLGCMLIELHTGYPVFAGKDEGDQIAVIVERLGMPPSYMLDCGKKTNMFFERNAETGAWSLKPSISEDHGLSRPASKPIRAFVDFHTGASNGRRKRASGGHSEEDYEIFLSLAGQMLRYDPDERITAEQALSDQFVQGTLGSSRSGRDSPPPMPPDLSSVDENVPHVLDPGRKAPVQRMGRGNDENARRDVLPMTSQRSRKGAASTSDGGDCVPNIGGKLRLSKSEPLFEPVPKKTFVFRRSDWAEEVGIEPPPWRAAGRSIRSISEGENWGGCGRVDSRNLTPAGGGCQLVRSWRCRTSTALGGRGNGGGMGAGSGALFQVGGPTDNVTWVAGVARWDEQGWEVRRAREVYAFGLGSGATTAAVRAAAVEDGRAGGQGRSVTPALPRGHGNALMLFTS